MTEEKRKSMRFWFFMSAPLVVGILVFLFTVFPATNFNDTSIRMYAPGRLSFDGRGFRGRVLGNHVLETEFGEIVLHRFARIYSTRYRNVGIIEEVNFTRGRASHNLVVEGMVIPQHVEITFRSFTQQLARLEIAPELLGRYFQELILSSVPLNVGRITFEPPRSAADIMIHFIASEYVTLADTTQIYFDRLQNGLPMLRVLYMYKEDERWVITAAGAGMTSVRRLVETEFTKYRSITFRPDWGEFIEGVLWE
jgi:hypothetical protein